VVPLPEPVVPLPEPVVPLPEPVVVPLPEPVVVPLPEPVVVPLPEVVPLPVVPLPESMVPLPGVPLFIEPSLNASVDDPVDPERLLLRSDMPDGSDSVVPLAGVIVRLFSWLHASTRSAAPIPTHA
jgi:hypothetical protein